MNILKNILMSALFVTAQFFAVDSERIAQSQQEWHMQYAAMQRKQYVARAAMIGTVGAGLYYFYTTARQAPVGLSAEKIACLDMLALAVEGPLPQPEKATSNFLKWFWNASWATLGGATASYIAQSTLNPYLKALNNICFLEKTILTHNYWPLQSLSGQGAITVSCDSALFIDALQSLKVTTQFMEELPHDDTTRNALLTSFQEIIIKVLGFIAYYKDKHDLTYFDTAIIDSIAQRVTVQSNAYSQAVNTDNKTVREESFKKIQKELRYFVEKYVVA